jgi:uncharacterized delta-60 repeat protein
MRPLLALLLVACSPDKDVDDPTDAVDETDPTVETDDSPDTEPADDTDKADDTDVAPREAPGAPDASFGDGGVVRLSLDAADDGAHSLKIADDGSIYVTARTFGTKDIQVLRFTPNGALDDDFGGDGSVEVTSSDTAELGFGPSLALRPDGVAIAGWIDGNNAVVAALDADGAPVAGFGSAGKSTFTLAALGFTPLYTTVLTDPDGAVFVVVGGETTTAAFKLTSGGLPDPAYGTAGKATISTLFGLTAAFDDQDRLLIAGSLSQYRAMARRNPDGTADTTFDSDGLRAYPGGGGTNFFAGFTPTSGGGFVANNPVVSATLEAYDDAGDLQTAFAGDGSVTLPPAYVALNLTDGPDLLATGGVDGFFNIYRLDLATGALVPSFSDDSIAQIEIGPAGASGFHAAIDAHQRLVIAGSSVDGTYDLVLARVWL